MGLTSSREDHWEQPSDRHQATLYYFAGRGLADQIRWMLAATDVPFTQKLISQREQLLRMSEAQLPFGQLPLLQIDGLELVQSQATVRYLARRAGLQGISADEVVKCDMIAEAVRDLLSLATSACFKRKYYVPPAVAGAEATTTGTGTSSSSATTTNSSVETMQKNPLNTLSAKTTSTATNLPPAPYDNVLQHNAQDPTWLEHVALMRAKWAFIGQRFEAILRSNRIQLAQQRRANNNNNNNNNSSSNNNTNSSNTSSDGNKGSATTAPAATTVTHYMVGNALTYADILVAHITTWYVEELGPEIVAEMPLVVALQNMVISLPGVTKFIKSIHYFPLSDRAYCEQVNKVLGRKV